jgi:hypothetical protein
MFTSDPTRGDGVIIDSDTRDAVALTEHVMVARSDEADVEGLILTAVESKRAVGQPYAAGKTLIVYLAAEGQWRANAVARQLPDPLLLTAVMSSAEKALRLVSMSMSSPSSISLTATLQFGAYASGGTSLIGQ